MSFRIFRALLVTALLAAVALYVWPTRWRYDHMTVGNDTYPVRIHRFTGNAYILIPGEGWTPAEDATDMDSSGADEPQGNKS